MKLVTYVLAIIVIGLSVLTRFYKLDSFPPSLYWEETALGYDAYSILKTGKDHHGHPFPIVAFESFGDWKPSLYFYTVVPFIAILGLNEWSVRLPAAVAGLITCFTIAQLAVLLLPTVIKKIPSTRQLFLFSLVVSLLSPWGILFSRAAWEVSVATALVTVGIYFGLQTAVQLDITKVIKWRYLYTSIVVLCLSMYTYHAARLIAPLIGLSLVALLLPHFTHQKSLLQQSIKQIVACFIFSLVLLTPLLLSLGSPEVTQRFNQTSIFSTGEAVARSNELRTLNNDSIWSRLVFHRYRFYAEQMIQNATSHFSIDFLFNTGDTNLRHSTSFTGQMYYLDLIGLVIGIFVLLKYRNKYVYFLVTWILISILPASITLATPHALRTLFMWPALMIVSIAGWIQLMLWVENKTTKFIFLKHRIAALVITSIIVVYLAQFAVFWRYYTVVYPQLTADWWQYGYKQVIGDLRALETEYPNDTVFITRSAGRPAMYYWFFNQTDPTIVQAAQATVKQDQGEFLAFENKLFFSSVSEVCGQTGLIVLYDKDQQIFAESCPSDTLEILKSTTQYQVENRWVIAKLN